jgi:hypothetical protein
VREQKWCVCVSVCAHSCMVGLITYHVCVYTSTHGALEYAHILYTLAC